MCFAGNISYMNVNGAYILMEKDRFVFQITT